MIKGMNELIVRVLYTFCPRQTPFVRKGVDPFQTINLAHNFQIKIYNKAFLSCK